MSSSGVRSRPAPLLAVTPQVGALLLAAALAWGLTVHRAAGMSAGGTGLRLPSFVGMWTLMMAAMMLPSVAPLASMYSRSVQVRRGPRLTAFVLGYLVVWAAVGIPAYGLARVAAELAHGHPRAATAAAVVAYGSCGLYQLTSFKQRCLRACRSPLSLLLHYGSYRGRLKDLAVGLHHGAYCAGCCWALFVLLLALGVMNLPAMAALAIVVLVEKTWRHGERFARATGVVALILAAAVVWVPELAPGLRAAPALMRMSGGGG